MDRAGFTTGELARRYRLPIHKIRRVFERNILPPAPRVGNYRFILAKDLPEFEEALRRAGYIKAEGVGVPAA